MWLEMIVMPSKFKNMVRERMQKTGESWQTAARHVRARTAPEPTNFKTPTIDTIVGEDTMF